jgi:23S rRNA (uracil1939-C5)-methyltransferase
VTYFHRMRHEGYLRHLLVRKAARTGEILVALVTTSQSPWGDCGAPEKAGAGNGERAADWAESGTAADAGRYGVPEGGERIAAQAGIVADEAVAGAPEEAGAMPLQKGAGGEGCEEAERQLIEGFQEKLLDLERNGSLEGRFAGILHIVNDSQADVVRSDRTDILYGQDYFYEELLGLRFKVSVFSFFQTNSYGAEVLYETARSYIGELGSGSPDGTPDKVVYDLYSGTGTIAQLMAAAAGKVIGMEIVEEAVLAARKNAEMNGLTNCEFIAGDVLKALDEIPEKPDFIILDPPRDGIHPKALGKIIAYGVERIVYISCKPTSLVRDLAVFLERGYQVERAVAVDQFPWTGNIETVCLLSNRKSKPDTHVKLSLSMDDYYRIKEEGKNNQ